MDLLDLLQWPAMATTLIAAWLVASTSAGRRKQGFYWFSASNGLWSVWGLYTSAYALVLMQVGLFALNVRGMVKAARTAGMDAPVDRPDGSPDTSHF
ncbi:MAG: hypothetical protein H5U27_11285 [Methyloversatilis sp.]|nr:hypothetical protein [Methyloversatilis sp.]